MATHSSTLAWKIRWMEEPGRLQSMGSQRVGYDWATFYFHALEKEMAAHSSVLAWRIPGMGEPGGLLSMGSHRVGHDWSNLAAAAAAAAAAACWGFSFKIHITISFHLSSLSALQYLSIKRTLGSFMEIYFLYSKPRMLLSFHYLRNSPLLSV